jgi:hypothetical protein
VTALRRPSEPERPRYSARSGEAIRVFRDADGAFAIGRGRITIAAQDARFVADVVADLGRIVHDPKGEVVLRQGDVLGRCVVIVKPQRPTEPPNAWIIPDDLAAAAKAGVAIGPDAAEGGTALGTGAGCGSRIVYDPADWPWPGDRRSPPSDAVLLRMLRQANRNASGESDPAAPDWGDGP